jgi:hypothetical protein
MMHMAWAHSLRMLSAIWFVMESNILEIVKDLNTQQPKFEVSSMITPIIPNPELNVEVQKVRRPCVISPG